MQASHHLGIWKLYIYILCWHCDFQGDAWTQNGQFTPEYQIGTSKKRLEIADEQGRDWSAELK